MFISRLQTNNDDIAEFVQLIAYIAEIKEWDNRDHLNRMRGYVKVICSGMNMSKKDIETISIASMLHDVGKAILPDELLKRKGDYSFDEWRLLEKHTIDSMHVIRASSSLILQTGVTIAATHHERWDGSGYPNKLMGEAIPLCGRICALADVFDALVTERPYKHVVEEKEAIEIILKSSGKMFDPNCIKVFEQKIDDILLIKNTSTVGEYLGE